jgi:hypothetical protein
MGITDFVEVLNDEPNSYERAAASRSLAWMRIGECVTSGDAVGFFSDHGGSNASAKRVCARCVVRDECLGYALRHEIEFGVWGGTSPRERKQLLRPGSRSTARS